jgi:spermidine/putrescine transport system ATP-binding protein
MRSIQLKNITKSYQDDVILENLNLTIPEGKFFALLGPSGCGKTTILRLIAGFETVDSGSIFLGDENITHKPINQRRVNTVFQNYALFPHMTVFENVAYGLVVKGVHKDEINERVIKVLRSVHLEAHIHKHIKTLSGGQQQRVALARAIINEPEVLLLDEPLAALDIRLREKVLIELIELQDKLKTTFIYVTHDPSEALTVADQMAIMSNGGLVEQIGTPKEIYEVPQSSFVAQFVGNTNIFGGTYQEYEGQPQIDIPNLGTFSIFIPRKKEWMVAGKPIVMSIRPEKFFITKKELEGFSNRLKGIVEAIVYHGRSTQYNIRLENQQLVQVFEQNEEHFPQQVIDYDNELYLYWQKENVVIVER